MKVLGIDPALQVTGYGIVDNSTGQPTYIASGVIITKSKMPLDKRLDAIYEGISSVILKYRPQVAVLEKVFVHHGHLTTAFLLGQVRGTVALACSRNGLVIEEYAATQAKKAVVGSGHASKQQIQHMVVSILKLHQMPRYYDITDALALALAHIFHSRGREFDGAFGRIQAMIARIRGKIIEQEGNSLLIEVNGITYRVLVPTASMQG